MHINRWWREGLTRRGRTMLIFSMGVGISAVVLLVVYAITLAAVNSTEINDRSESREGQVEANDQALKIIQDCTDTNGECFRANQRRLASAVRDIGAGNILAVVCALQVPNGTQLQDAIAQVNQCVADQLRK